MSRILIIDDDVSMTELLKILVMMEGHTPITLSDSTKAIEMAGSVDPDLSITPWSSQLWVLLMSAPVD